MLQWGVTLGLYVVIPLLLIYRVTRRRTGSFGSWVLDAGVAVVWLMGIGLAGLWLSVPRWILWGQTALLAGAALLRGLSRDGTTARAGHPQPGWMSGSVRALLLIIGLAVSATALIGRRPLPGSPVDLQFPLRDPGVYLIANGGSVELLNPHLATLDRERSRAYRGQSYALDIVALGGWGSRVSAGIPREPGDFQIFDLPVHAPCSGEVIRRRDGEPDGHTSNEAWTLREGNHLILDCSGSWILLAHLRRGSVLPEQGIRVRKGEVVGRVGNSGASGEPHLHIHAQTPGTLEAPIGGSPLPITFHGRTLVRNDRVRIPGTEAAVHTISTSGGI